MWIFWLIAFLWVAIGTVFFCRSKEIHAGEWLAGAVVALIMAAGFQWAAVTGMTHDREVWSGQVESARHVPAWTEQYTRVVTRTVGSGKNMRTITELRTETDYNPEHWFMVDTLGRTLNISEAEFNEIRQITKAGVERQPGDRSNHIGGHMISGDPLDDVLVGLREVMPVVDTQNFENRVRAAPTVFSFPKVPPTVKVEQYPWPQGEFISNRVINAPITALEWDRLNSLVGPAVHCNAIIVYFKEGGPEMAQWQKAAWVGGKKNDLVICYGGKNPSKAEWVDVFGWTEAELVKANLRTLVLKNQVNNQLVPQIQAEIMKNFKAKDWHKFDYISIEPPPWAYITFFITLSLFQAGTWWWFHNNAIDRHPRRWGWNRYY